MRSLQLTLFALAGFLFLTACSSTQPAEEIQSASADDFDSVINRFYDAERNRDWATMWNFFVENMQEELPLDEFVAMMQSQNELESLRIVNIERHGPNEDMPDIITDQVEVIVERVEIEEPDLYGINEGTDLWFQAGGSWYWALRY